MLYDSYDNLRVESDSMSAETRLLVTVSQSQSSLFSSRYARFPRMRSITAESRRSAMSRGSAAARTTAGREWANCARGRKATAPPVASCSACQREASCAVPTSAVRVAGRSLSHDGVRKATPANQMLPVPLQIREGWTRLGHGERPNAQGPR